MTLCSSIRPVMESEEEISTNSYEIRTDNPNYSRMACLLIQEGTRCAQEAVLMHLPERKTFVQVVKLIVFTRRSLSVYDTVNHASSTVS